LDLSFTALSLGARELTIVAEVFLANGSFAQTKKIVLSENLLQKSTASTNSRIAAEAMKRLSFLDNDEMMLLIDTDSQTKKYIAFLAIIKTYSLIFEFCVEVLRYKYVSFDNELLDSDWNQFIEAKRVGDEKLSRATENTIKKIKQVIYLMLSDAGLIDSGQVKFIYAPLLSSELKKVIWHDDPRLLAAFNMSDADINSIGKGV